MNLLDKPNRLLEYFIVFVFLLLALYLRLLPYPIVITKNAINFFAQDPYYHARRIQLALTNHWIIPSYDSYSGFPQGLYCFWSNLFDYSILWVSLIWGLGHPSIRQMEIITALAPSIWGVLSLVPAYLLIRKIFNERIALLSLLIFSILPGHIYQTLIGRADHYGADAIFPLFMYYYLIKGLESEDKREIIRNGIVSGIFCTLSWLIWPGSTIFVGIAMLFLLIHGLVYSQNKNSGTHALSLSLITFFTSWLTLSPFCLISYWGKHGLIQYDALSWFQWLLLIYVIIFFGIAKLLQDYLQNHGHPKIFYPIGILGTIFILFLANLFLLPDFNQSVLSGLGWVGKTDPWLKTITEFQPLFVSMGVFSTFRANSFFSYGIYLLPLIYIGLFIGWYRKKVFNTGKLWLLVYILCISILGLNQTRFSHFFAFLVALGLSILLATLWDSREILLKRIRNRGKVMDIVYGCLLLFITYYGLTPCFQEIHALRGKYAMVDPIWNNTLTWVREKTPPTSHFDKPYRTPEYGILAPWITGHWINYIAHRPTVTNGFHTDKENNLEGMKFFLSEDLHDSKSIVEEKKIRYILLTDMIPNLQDYARILDKGEIDYVTKIVEHPPMGGTRISFLPAEKYFNLISSKLYMEDGIGLYPKSNGIYRLVYESPESWNVIDKKVNCIKLFEYVKGATLRGIGTPGKDIKISVPIKTNSERIFEYSITTTVPREGAFQFILPYSDGDCPYETQATSPYTIQLGKQKYQLHVDEKSVFQGKIIILQ